jgi:predicted permease
MFQLVILFFFLALGLGASTFFLDTLQATRISRLLNRWVIRVALPALILQKIHALPEFSLTTPEIFLPVSQPWIHFFLSMLLLTFLARIWSWKRETWAALVLVVGLGNTSFVGLPLLGALLGPESLGTGVVLDQLGSFLILSAIGAPFAQTIATDLKREHAKSAASLLSRRPLSRTLAQLALRPLRFPPFMTLLLALSLRFWEFPESLSKFLGALAMTLGPVALVSVGLSMRWVALRRPEVRQPLGVALALKLFIFPAVYWFLYSRWALLYPELSALTLKTILLEASMASMITAGVVAAENELDPDLAQLMVGVSIPLSLVTVPLWSRVF